MSSSFDGSATGYLLNSVGVKCDPLNSAITMAAIIRPAFYATTLDVPFAQAHGSVLDAGLYVNNSSYGFSNVAKAWVAGNSLATGKWVLIAFSAQIWGATNLFTGYTVDLETLTMAPSEHAWDYSAQGTPTASAATRTNFGGINNTASVAFFGGEVLVGAHWTRSLTYNAYAGTTPGNGYDDWVLGLASSLSAWRRSDPAGLWIHDTPVTTQRVNDDTGNGGNFLLGGATWTINTDSIPNIGYHRRRRQSHKAPVVATRRRVHVI